MALARAGVGRLVIADFDIVTLENLDRQYYFRDQVGQKKVLALQENIRRVNPDIDVQVHDVCLGPDEVLHIFKNCQVIVEAFDRADMKLMIIETVSERFPDKFIVAGSGLAGYGDNNALRTRRLGNLFICGDETSEVSRGTAAPGAARGRGGGHAGQPGAGDRHGRPGARRAATTSGTNEQRKYHEDQSEQ